MSWIFCTRTIIAGGILKNEQELQRFDLTENSPSINTYILSRFIKAVLLYFQKFVGTHKGGADYLCKLQCAFIVISDIIKAHGSFQCR